MRQAKALMSTAQMRDEAKRVFELIEQQPWFAQAQSVMLYYSLPDELPTHDVVRAWSRDKTIYLPRVAGDEIEVVRYHEGEFATSARYGIEEPLGPALTPSVIDLLIVPAIAVDEQCHRLGRGGGFYDRFMARQRVGTAIAVALDCQVVDTVPTLPHDIALQAIITASHFFTSKH